MPATALGGGSSPAWPGMMFAYKMRKDQLARRLAKESGVSTAAAADQLDRIITDILTRVRKGQSAALPGLGTFRPGSPGLQFDLGLHQRPREQTHPGSRKGSR